MAQTTFLQIKTRAAASADVLRLEGPSVRIGRGSQCEVQLDEPGLAEVHCLLRRRGETWYVQPVGPPGVLSIEGRSVEAQRPLVPGVPLRVGGHWLTLRNVVASPGLGSFEAPINVESASEAEPVVTARPDSRAPTPPSASLLRPSAPRDDDHERPGLWASRSAGRRPWVKARQDQVDWESKWRIGGSTTEPRPETPAPGPTTSSLRSAIAALRESVGVAAPETPPADDPGGMLPSSQACPPEMPNRGHASEDGSMPPAVAAVPTDHVPTIIRATTGSGVEAWGGGKPFVADSGPGIVIDSQVETTRGTPRMGVSAAGAIGSDHVQGVLNPSIDRSAPKPIAIEDDLSSWPSVARILADSASRTTRPRASKHPKSRPIRPEPTASSEPSRWSPPAWLVLPPAAIVAVASVAACLGLCFTWGVNDQVAGLVADRVVGRETLPERAVIDLADLPDASWWRSTSDHAYLFALAASRDRDDPDAEERSRELLAVARGASPLHAAARFADPGAAPLGVSNDVLTLQAAARGLARAGKVEEALDTYRRAIELALQGEPDRSRAPAFDEDERIRRFLMPDEDRIGQVVREMAGHDGWAFERWRSALPDSPRVALAAYRVLSRAGRSGATLALEMAAESAPTDAVDRAARAEALAFQSRWDEADAAYREAIEAMPIDPIRRSWWLNVAAIADRRHQPEQQRAAWDEARGERGGDPIARRVVEARTRAGAGQMAIRAN